MACIDENGNQLGRCLHVCKDEEECKNECLKDFETNKLDCPCQVTLAGIHKGLSCIN